MWLNNKHMNKITQLGIGLVTSGEIQAKTACSIISALPNGFPIQMLLGESCYIHMNRESVVDLAFKTGCSHLLFVDSDMLFGNDAITKLIAHDVPIVAGRYNKRYPPHASTVPGDLKELTEVPFVPTGFLLIDMEVFKKIGKPYFSFNDGAESEDVYFCNKAIKNGYKVYVDPTIQIGHIGTAIF